MGDSIPGQASEAVTTLSVREFVAPLLPSGSLDAGRASLLEEDALTLGTRLHGRIQKRLQAEDPATRTEVALQETLSRPGFSCRVRGRIDVLREEGGVPLVEEIKTSSRPAAVLKAVASEAEHPFVLQVSMYAWLHFRETGKLPRCRLRVASLLDEQEVLHDLDFDPEAFSLWVEGRLEALQELHTQALARAAARRELGTRLLFPFQEPRPGQGELVARVEAALEAGEKLLLQAPTGLGKTAAVLFPALRRALLEDLQVFYATPRNSQHEVAENCVRHLLPGVRSVTLRAKEKVCPQAEVDCRPEVCLRAEGYYDRLLECGAVESLAQRGCATSAVIAEVADRHGLCPFELSLDAARGADVVIGDYNHAFSPNASIQRLFGSPESARRQIVLVDEAHNLPARAADWFSPALETAWLQNLRKPRTRFAVRGFKGRVTAQMKRCLACLEGYDGPHRSVEPEVQAFYGEEQRIGRLVAEAAAAGQELAPSHPLLELRRGWSAFCEGLRGLGEEHGVTWIPPGRLQITCADASEHLASRMGSLACAVLFSGTLKPFEFHKRLSGLGAQATCEAEVTSPFPPGNRKVLVVPQVSTLLKRRERELPRIAGFLERVLPLRHGNYFVFFPSFDMLEKARALLDLPGFRILAQPRRATGEQIQEILGALRSERGLVVLAVQGGSLSEGVDCPGDSLIGCVVVGPPLPPFDLEREHVRRHFQRKYGFGQSYAYTFPAAARAVQAAGRVLRTPMDRGLIIFLDGRFLEADYASCFPQGWFQESPRELVSSAILKDVAAFWAAQSPRALSLGSS